MGELSPIAKAVSVLWGNPMGRDMKLSFEMIKSRPTDLCQQGLDELLDAGLLTVKTINVAGGVEYSPSPDLYEIAKSAAQVMMNNPDALPKVQISTPIAGDAT